MQAYQLTSSAQEDLKEIARYTRVNWGKKQSLHYASLLESKFNQIVSKSTYSRTFSERYPQIQVSRCEHHYIFYVYSQNNPVRILAVLHERMDFIAQLKNRLE